MASGTQIHELKVEDYMTDNPITIQSAATVPEAITIMASKRIGNLIVTKDDNTVIGLLTEREILQYLLSRETPNKNIEYTVLQPFSRISPNDKIHAAARSMISNKTRLLVFDDNNNSRLIGIITASDIVKPFRGPSYMKDISQMPKSIITMQFIFYFHSYITL